ncbi:hypothetical protein [Alishewanella sp. HL-SH06]|uniref:hypothetical protein n=1 Tax=Alishewanella sp. HL-SH06 TaxID=3461144 RepID=UPI00404335D4
MTSIAENSVDATREMNHRFNMIDNVDNLSKLVVQSRALITSMLMPDNLQCMHPETIANLLWLLADRLDEMENVIPNFNSGVLQ